MSAPVLHAGDQPAAAKTENAAVDLAAILAAEAIEINEARSRRPFPATGPVTPRHTNTDPAPPAQQLVGLAFSGGGIRSATFNLGVLQGLAELGLLPMFDYLSTVSGGGYIGTWLVSWIHRRGFSTVFENLRTDIPRTEEPPEIRRLREYSNYLTPKLGLTSGDTWAFIGGYVRNLVLNQVILTLVLVALMLMPWLAIMYFWMIAGAAANSTAAYAGSALIVVALTSTILNLSGQARHDASPSETRLLASPIQIELFVLLPMALGISLLWAWWWPYSAEAGNGTWTYKSWQPIVYLGAWHTALWVIAWLIGVVIRGLIGAFRSPNSTAGEIGRALQFWKFLRWINAEDKRAGLYILAIIAGAFLSGAVGGELLMLLTNQLDPGFSHRGDWAYAFWGLPLAVFLAIAIQILHIGLVGRRFTDDAREWWGRLGGIMAFRTLALSAFCGVAIHGPSWLASLGRIGLHGPALASAWSVITGAGVLVGRFTSGPSRTWRALVVRLAPPIFILGLVLALSELTGHLRQPLTNLTHTLLNAATRNAGPTWIDHHLGQWPDDPKTHATYPAPLGVPVDACLWISILGLAGVAMFLAYRTGINRFSMSSLYRNRLVRCYLGASKTPRKAHPFTGMDPGDDDIHFGDLGTPSWNQVPTQYAGPYPIYNAALNLVDTKNLAWQQRKAASFVFTPLYSGFAVVAANDQLPPNGFRPSALIDHLGLGLGMAISGAAASPNMGYQSTPALAFLLTVFNVRLGWWMGNPLRGAWRKLGPGFGLLHLFSELTGQTNYERRFVYLSDGGHFENLGLYELVRRRCRFIVVCDAGEDHALQFGDLGNAIEKCRTDLCVDISIDIEPLRRKGAGPSTWHCAVGTIHYDRMSPGLPSGTLVYMKTTLSGNEPTDIKRYADQCREFPHQSTADQWFTESQFESYRALGHHIVHSTFDPIGTRRELELMSAETLFVRLRKHWYPPSRFTQASFTKHTATYTTLLQKLREATDLAFLDAQVYPEWRSLVRGTVSSHIAKPGLGTKRPDARTSDLDWLPATEGERRAGFYFCNEVIQLMEDAYLDLNLDEEFNHPDNRGWSNLFGHWAGSAMFRATWAISVGIYGARFQSFCERRMSLWPGRVVIGQPAAWPGRQGADAGYWQRLQSPDAQDLNSWEVELIKMILEGESDPPAAGAPALDIIPIEMIVQHEPRVQSQQMRFTIGFAIGARGVASLEIQYFRIQDHIRKMGLAREALKQLIRAHEGQVTLAPLPTVPRPAAPREWGEPSRADAQPSHEAIRVFTDIFQSVKLREKHPK